MNKYLNMNIEINESQPLTDVIHELERLGFKKAGWVGYRNVSFVTTSRLGFYTDHAVSFWSCFGGYSLTTLAELKEVKRT